MQSARLVAAVAELGSLGHYAAFRFDERFWTADICDNSVFRFDKPMKKRARAVGEEQWHWKITVTVLSAIVGAILALYLFRVL